MPPIDTEAQFKFLLCCIKHSAAGKVNFDKVADELEIVSKAAAAKRYERLLKAHNISPSTPRKSKANADAEDGDDQPKTPASKKRKRATAAVKKQDDDEAGPSVKKERTRVKKEESDEDDGGAIVKGEDDGSLPPHTTATPCRARGGVPPEAFPRRQRGQSHGPPDDVNDDYCVVIGERPVSATVLVPTVPALVAYGHGGYPHGALPTRNFGNHHAAVYCHDTDLGFPPQMTSTSRSNPSLGAGSSDATLSSPAIGNWGVSQSPPPPPPGFCCGRHHLLQ
ncbi:hypothetical protein C8A00DRAFT_13726 [Chaetomidium leptoderma]|uniref:Myb-like DNA-binding domain-containing protein n=1 Tax=Chaetomidium leptoderma TaxID=669021 RepID=A0AAN6VRP8_9PEZI|nr:hypothetical protein C8A00DRAFT_13726 [Chaetomidium leptoderma]